MTQLSFPNSVASHVPDLAVYEQLRKHFHSHPELSLQEAATAAKVVSHLESLNAYTITTNIGGHGLAAVLKNGPGKTILLRADMDALPVKEQTGLSFASEVQMQDNDGLTKPVMHACGHDIHITCLLAAAEQMAKTTSLWSGTLILVFQPNEERGGGAQAMVDDGLYDKVPIPDYVLGQHVFPYRAGSLGNRVGIMLAASDSFKITLYGRGGHASMPNRTIDPAVMAAAVVMRLQTVVSREVDPSEEMAVVTVGSLQAGNTENIIGDTAELKINVRTISQKTRERVLAAIRRIVRAECEASGAPKPPLIEPTSSFPVTLNDERLTETLSQTFQMFFESSYNNDIPRANGSEDFGVLGTAIGKPCSFWLVGGTDPELWDEAMRKGTVAEDVPVNHSPFFAPVMQPTLKVGTTALVVAAMTFLHAEQ